MTIEKAAVLPGKAPGANVDAEYFCSLQYQSNAVLIPEIRAALLEIFVEVALDAHRKRCCRHARKLSQLRPECTDRVTRGAEALLVKFGSMTRPILKLKPWAAKALANAEVDMYRRERGEREALQRSRVPQGLQRALHDDRRLVELARRMIDFVGVPRGVGGSGWPTGAWSSDPGFAALGGGAAVYSERACERDVAHVLRVMEAWNPTWLDQRILVPLSNQSVPVAIQDDTHEADGPSTADDREAELRDRLLLDAAADLLDALAERLAVGDRAPAEVVHEVLEEFLKLGGVRLTDAAIDEIVEIVGASDGSL